MPRRTQIQQPLSSPDLKYQRTISTAELPFAAYIKARYRLPLVDINKSGQGRVTWSFELHDKDEMVLVNEFHRGGMVAATEYFSELKNLKSTTYTV